MKVLFVHPSPLMYSEIYLRLEPLGLELVAQAVRGHAEVRLGDAKSLHHVTKAAKVLLECLPRTTQVRTGGDERFGRFEGSSQSDRYPVR